MGFGGGGTQRFKSQPEKERRQGGEKEWRIPDASTLMNCGFLPMFKGYFPRKIINSLGRALSVLYLTGCLADCKHINAHCYNENKNTQLPLPLLI